MNNKTFTKKCSILALLMLLLSQSVYAQTKEGNNWYFGEGGRLTWNQTQSITDGGKTLAGLPTPITTPSGMPAQQEGVFCMSDVNGNLLFYSNGMTIWNREHQAMQNGDGLYGHYSSAQSGIVIPYPGQPTKYIALSMSLNANTTWPNNHIGNRLAYSIVDMTLDNGRGAVTTEKNILLTGAMGVLGESVAAVRHSNGVDIWIIAVGKGSGQNSCLNVWRITPTEINTVCVGSYPLMSDTDPTAGANGYLRFSSDGKYFAWAENTSSIGSGGRLLHFGEFDPSTGTFPTIKVINRGISYGNEFSPSSEILYTGCLLSIRSYRFADLLALPNNSTGTTSSVAYREYLSPSEPPPAPLVSVCAVQLGPDGRIYGVLTNSSDMLVIDNPDSYNDATSHALSGLMAGMGRTGLPNFLPHIFAPAPQEGVIGSNQTICSGGTPAQLTSVADASCADGGISQTITYLWQQSADSASWSTATGTTNLATYQPPSLTATTYYRRNATSASCGTLHSNVVKITVENCVELVDDYSTTFTGKNDTIPVLVNDTYPSSCNLTIAPEITSVPSVIGASASVVGKNIVYKPVAGFVGRDSIKYRLSCGGSTETATVYISVVPYLDNIIDAECYANPPVQDWSIAEVLPMSRELVDTHGQILTGDLDGDGSLEIIITNNTNPSATIRSSMKVFNYDKSTQQLVLKRSFTFPNSVTVNYRCSGAIFRYNGQGYIVMPGNDGYLYAYGIDGSQLWKSDEMYSAVAAQGAATIVGIADFNNDGIPEIYAGNKIFTYDGTLLCDGGTNNSGLFYFNPLDGTSTVAADIDGDGKLELIAGTQIYDVNIAAGSASGTMGLKTGWQLPDAEFNKIPATADAQKDRQALVADIDNDGKLEIVVSGLGSTTNRFTLYVWKPQANDQSKLVGNYTTDRKSTRLNSSH